MLLPEPLPVEESRNDKPLPKGDLPWDRAAYEAALAQKLLRLDDERSR